MDFEERSYVERAVKNAQPSLVDEIMFNHQKKEKEEIIHFISTLDDNVNIGNMYLFLHGWMISIKGYIERCNKRIYDYYGDKLEKSQGDDWDVNEEVEEKINEEFEEKIRSKYHYYHYEELKSLIEPLYESVKLRYDSFDNYIAGIKNQNMSEICRVDVVTDQKDFHGRTGLMFAADILSKNEILEILMRKVTDIDAKDNEGKTALIHFTLAAITNGVDVYYASKVIDAFSKQHARFDIKDNSGKTALMHLVEIYKKNHNSISAEYIAKMYYPFRSYDYDGEALKYLFHYHDGLVDDEYDEIARNLIKMGVNIYPILNYGVASNLKSIKFYKLRKIFHR